jgi:hypothetical protein
MNLAALLIAQRWKLIRTEREGYVSYHLQTPIGFRTHPVSVARGERLWVALGQQQAALRPKRRFAA